MVRFSSPLVRLTLAAAILFGCVGCDQATKHLATQKLRGAEPYSLMASALRLQYAQNPGGFLSLGGQAAPTLRFWLFIALNTVFLAGVVYVVVKGWHMRLAAFVSLLFIFAGGIGNLIDRILNDGLVTDFIILGFGPLHTGIFNVADVAITCGGLAFALVYGFDACREVG